MNNNQKERAQGLNIFLYKFIMFSFISAVFTGLFAVAFIFYISFDLPDVNQLMTFRPSIPSEILSKDGQVLLTIGRENRDIAKFDEIPKLIVDAFISAEDANFFEHDGVDYMGILRAMGANLKAGRIVQGGSTITQQVAKSLLLTREKSFIRKIKDVLLAQKIEETFTKEEILYIYLNHVYLGGGYYGVRAAFKGYFDKELNEATAAESALVAGLLVAPGKYSPYVDPKMAKRRQRYVLKRMYTKGKIGRDEFKKSLEEKIKLRVRTPSPILAGYFTDWVRQDVLRLVGEENFLNQGYKVTTTLNWKLQKIAERELNDGLKDIDKRQGFKGPLDHLLDSERNNYQIKYRTDFFQKHSNYFVLGPNGEKTFEFEFSEDQFQNLMETFKTRENSVKWRNFHAGNRFDNDEMYDYLKVDDNYKAVVIGVNNAQRIIYVSIGGIRGIIPYHQFRWAHPRVIDEQRKFFPFVTRPSTIVKKGDVVNVNIIKKKASLWNNLWEDHRKNIKTKEYIDDLKSEQFLLCGLDQEVEVEGALVSIRPQTGEIITMVGGHDFSKSQFNRAIQSLRQPGSSFKPLLYAAALENGYNPAKIIIDGPEALGGIDETLNWKPKNYDGLFKGPMTFRRALEQSRNVPTIKIAEDIGIPTILEFIDRIGLKANIPKDLSLSLGSFGVTLLDLVSAYGIFPNQGRKVEYKHIYSIKNRSGEEIPLNLPVSKEEASEGNEVDENSKLVKLEEEKKESDPLNDEEEHVEEKKVNVFKEGLDDKQVYDKRLAYIMTNLLRGVIQNGTGRAAKSVSSNIGGKTGTTNKYVDAWFLGFSNNLATGVWTGFDDNKTLGWGETGAKSALPIWRGFMAKAIKYYGNSDFLMPNGIINIGINRLTGRISRDNDESSFMESFAEGFSPLNDQEMDEKTKKMGQLLDEDDYYKNL